MDTMWKVLVALAVACLVVILVAACGFEARSTYEDPESARIRARAGATATVVAARTESRATETALELEERRQEDEARAERSERAHRQFLETVPVLLLAAGGVLVGMMAVLVAWWMMREQDLRREAAMHEAKVAQAAGQLPATVVHVWNLPPPQAGQSRRVYYRQIEQQVVDGAIVKRPE